MNEIITKIEKLERNLKTAAFLVSRGNSEQDAHGKIVESLLIVSRLTDEINFLFENNLSVVSMSQIGKKISSTSNAESEEIEKVKKRIPKWFRNPCQQNSLILITYLKLSEQHHEIKVKELKNNCSSIKDFEGNYNQMKNIGEKNHGKVFEERNDSITLWEPVKEYILKQYDEEKESIALKLHSENFINGDTQMTKNSFLERTRVKDKNDAIDNSIKASLGRNSTYLSDISHFDRQKFRISFAKQIQSYAEHYSKPVSDEVHIENIKKICSDISEEHGDILIDSKLKFGTAQKAFNLYLKFLWCLDQNRPNPPHCPIDRIILNCAGIAGSWTQLDSEDIYRDWIKKLKQFALQNKFDSLQHWELSIWNENS